MLSIHPPPNWVLNPGDRLGNPSILRPCGGWDNGLCWSYPTHHDYVQVYQLWLVVASMSGILSALFVSGLMQEIRVMTIVSRWGSERLDKQRSLARSTLDVCALQSG